MIHIEYGTMCCIPSDRKVKSWWHNQSPSPSKIENSDKTGISIPFMGNTIDPTVTKQVNIKLKFYSSIR